MHDHSRLHPHHRDDLDQPSVEGRRRAVALAILCLCALVAGIDMTITNVALPFIGRALDAPTNELQWIVDSYNIALAGLIVLGGAVADRHGRRRVFLASFLLFALGSMIAAFSPNAGVLIAARSVMGVAAAGFTAPALAIIASMYPPEQRARAISVFVVFGSLGLAVGPVAGGFLLDQFWWGSVFLVNVPIVLVGVVLGARTIPESRAPTPAGGQPPLDSVGALLSVLGLGGVLFGVIEGPSRGWTAPIVVFGLVGGAIALAAFVRRELRDPAPLFHVAILRRPAVASGALTLLIAYVLFDSFLFLNPQFLQDVRGESIMTVGLLFVPFAVAFGLCSLGAQRTLQRLGPRATVSVGLLVGAAACCLFAIALDGALWLTLAASVVLGGGLSLLIAPPSTIVMNDLPPERAGDGSSLNFVARFAGASVGVAVVGTILASIFANDVGDAATSLDAAQTSTVEGSLQGALEVAATLPTSSADDLITTSRDAFVSGATVAYVVIAVLCAVAAAVAWAALGRSGGRSTTGA